MSDRENKKTDQVDYDNETFFTNSISMTHSSSNVVIDFKQRNTRVNDIGGNLGKTLVTHHRPVVMKPKIAKILLKILSNVIRKYEKQFGKIQLHEKEKKKVQSKMEEGSHYIG